MKRLLKNGTIINVFTGELEKLNVLIENEYIVGIGDYEDAEADEVIDVQDKVLCPGFIDGHIHIESSMCTPYQFAKACLVHGTTSVIADPHEIANVLGVDGIRYMLEASEGLPMHIYYTLPSCVPASALDETGAILEAEDLEMFYKHPRIVGLGEMMNFPGVIYNNPSVMAKIENAHKNMRVVDGHSPSLRGKDLDKYIAKGITSEHECTTLDEALEKMRKGQWIMIRQGTAAHNLKALLPLFNERYYHRCLLVCDDIHPDDLIKEGHLDRIIRLVEKEGESVIKAIQMVSIHAASRFNLKGVGAIAPGYRADFIVLNDLKTLDIQDVYVSGLKVVANKEIIDIEKPKVDERLVELVNHSFVSKEISKEDFYIEEKSEQCRVIEIIPGQIITNEIICDINWQENNGIDLKRDLLKLAVIERHKNTGHIGLGFIKGIGLKKGAIASSVSHDSHNIIVIGTNDEDMAIAANHIRKVGGNVVVLDGKVLAELTLPIAGLMSELEIEEIAKQNEKVRQTVYELGVSQTIEPFMNMAFVSLPVIPYLKITTQGLVQVTNMERVSLYV